MYAFSAGQFQIAFNESQRAIRAELTSADLATLRSEARPFSELSFSEKFRACLDLGVDWNIRQSVAADLLKEREREL